MDEKLNMVKSDLRSSLITNKDALLQGVPQQTVLSDYRDLVGEILPFNRLGFRDLESFCQSIPDVVQVLKRPAGTLYKLVSCPETARVESLVARQKSKKPKGSRKQASRAPQRRPNRNLSWKSPVFMRPMNQTMRPMNQTMRPMHQMYPTSQQMSMQHEMVTGSGFERPYAKPFAQKPVYNFHVPMTPSQFYANQTALQAADNRRFEVPPRFRNKPVDSRPKPSDIVRTINNSNYAPLMSSATTRNLTGNNQKTVAAVVPPKQLSNVQLKARVCEILERKRNGFWDTMLAAEYFEVFKEKAPDNLLNLLAEWPDAVQIVSAQGTPKRILYPVVQQSAIKLTQSNTAAVTVIPAADLPTVG